MSLAQLKQYVSNSELNEKSSNGYRATAAFLMLENGDLQRKSSKDEAVSIVAFERYAFDMSQFTKAGETLYKPSERSLDELLNPNANDEVFKKVPAQILTLRRR